MGILTKFIYNRNASLFIKTANKVDYRNLIEGYSLNRTRENNSWKDYIELFSGLSIEEVLEKNIFYYLSIRHKVVNTETIYSGYLLYTVDDMIIEQDQEKVKPLYERYPEEEGIKLWLEDRWNDPEEKSYFNLNSKRSIWETYKKLFKYKGNYKVHEIKDTNSFLNEAYKVFVCEELRIIYYFELCELKTTKGMLTTLYADFENSPLFDDKFLTTDEKQKKRYYKNLDKFAKSVGYERMDQEALVEFIKIKKKATYKLNNEFRHLGYKFGRENVWKFLELNMEPELFELCKTYTIFSNPYYFKKFTKWHLLNDCGVYFSADYEDKRNSYGCKLSELEARKKLPTLSEYFNLTEEDEWIVDTKIADEKEKEKARRSRKFFK
ncbi:MAG: hypothetical protein ACK5NF_03195 [Bacilli bacterium]